MPYVPPVVGYLGRPLATGNYRMSGNRKRKELAMNEKTLFDLIKAYGQARHNEGVAVDGAALRRAFTKADDLLNAIWNRIRNARDDGFTETGVAIGDILDGKK